MTTPAFGRLFDYISGENTSGDSIAMTAPVLMEADGEEWRMAFVLPEGMDAASDPRPTDPLVEIVDIAGPRMASLRFSGWMGEESIR